MDETIDTLMIDVRASTQGFQSDIETMRSAVDTSLGGGFAKAGDVLERGLLSAIRRGSLGFDDLKRAALQTMDEIAAIREWVRAGGVRFRLARPARMRTAEGWSGISTEFDLGRFDGGVVEFRHD